MLSSIASILLAILPAIVNIVGWLIENSKATKEQKEAFYRWVKKAGEDFGSVRLMEKGRAQLDFLKDAPFEETKA